MRGAMRPDAPIPTSSTESSGVFPSRGGAGVTSPASRVHSQVPRRGGDRTSTGGVDLVVFLSLLLTLLLACFSVVVESFSRSCPSSAASSLFWLLARHSSRVWLGRRRHFPLHRSTSTEAKRANFFRWIYYT